MKIPYHQLPMPHMIKNFINATSIISNIMLKFNITNHKELNFEMTLIIWLWNRNSAHVQQNIKTPAHTIDAIQGNCGSYMHIAHNSANERNIIKAYLAHIVPFIIYVFQCLSINIQYNDSLLIQYTHTDKIVSHLF